MRTLSRYATLILATSVAACSQGDKREFLDPQLPKNPSILARVVVTPPAANLITEELAQFRAYGRSTAGDSIPVEVTWRASGGSINGDGYFVADDAGTYSVTAVVTARPEIADSVSVAVERRPKRLVAVLVDPAPVSITEGDTQEFTAVGYYDDGSVQSEKVDWSTTGGLIDTAGVYVADTPAGDYDIVARARRDQTIGLARIKVTRRETSTAFDISPSPVSLTPGQSVTFSGVITWDDGSQSSPAIAWTATGGSISSLGRYVAGSVAGNFRVIGKVVGGKRADTVQVTIQAPAIASVSVTPVAATLAPGGSVRFQASGLDVLGNVRSVSVNWSATGGTINSTGSYTAGSTAGTYRVIGQVPGGGPADTSVVTITGGAPSLVSVSLTPASASVPSGTTKQFAVSAQWSDGSTAVPPVTWSATGGTITSAGLYTAGASTGAFRVIAAHSSGKADTSAVTVTAPTTTAISVTPTSAIVNTGATQQFSASATLSNGLQSSAGVTWAATGGTISSTGLYTAGSTPGSYLVIGSQNGVADTVSVAVQSVATPTLAALTVSPKSTAVLASATQQYAVTGTWSNGTTGTPPVTWSATGGTITSGGLFKAGTSNGTYRVIAKYTGGNQADTAAVTVSVPTLVSLSLSPASLSVPTGGTQQFSVSGSLSNGSSTTPSVSYSATGGTITAAGLYTAGSVAGTYRVVAKEVGGSLADTSTVTVTATAPTLTAVVVNPASASVTTGGTKQFSVSGTLSNGSTTTPAVTWSATGGTVTAAGLYTAGSTAGTFRVIAKVQGGTLADTATVTVAAAAAPTLVGIQMTPHTLSVPTGGSAQLATVALMSDGSSSSITPTYSATGGTITAAGRYTAGGTTGNYRVIASYSSKADTTTVTVTPPASYTALYSDDFANYANDTDFKTAYSNNNNHELWGFSPVPWNKTGLIPDNVFGKALKTVHEQQTPYYDLAKYPSGMPGSTTRLRVVFMQGNMSHVWVRFYVKYAVPPGNTIGWTTKSPNDPSPYGGSYKVFFLHWPAPYYERGSMVYTNTRRLDAEFYVKTLTKTGETPLPGSGTSHGMSSGTEFANGEWYEMIYLYQRIGTNSSRAGAWVRQYTVGGVKNPQAYKWWASDNFYSGPVPLAESMELGGNKNHGNQFDQWVIWGPWEVVDGTKFYNPWGVPGI